MSVGKPVDYAELSDAELVARVALSDPDALATLYDRHAAAVHGLIRTVLRDDRLAEEATHDVFLGLWQNPNAYQPTRGVFVAWLLRVGRNRAIDLLRRRREQPFALTVMAESGQVLDPATWLVDPDPDPADQAASHIVGQHVRQAMSHLGADHRRLLEMAYFGGLTQREIAIAVNRPLGTVKTQIRTAMQRLAEMLADDRLESNTRWREHSNSANAFDSTRGEGAESR